MTALLHEEELAPAPQPRRAGKVHAYFFGAADVRRLRPFARRCLRTFRPPGVFMRFLKPCVRFRRCFFG